MATTTLNTRIIMRNDSPENWANNNPVLAKGEIGIAIDQKTGHSTMKVGDGVHHWNDLTLDLGEASLEQSYISAYGPRGEEVARWINEQTATVTGYNNASAGRYSIVTGYHTPGTDATTRLNEFQGALNRIAKAARECGISVEQAVAATNAFVSAGQPLAEATGNALKEIAQKIGAGADSGPEIQSKEEPAAAPFDIPRFDINDYKIDVNEELFNFDYKPTQFY